MMTALKRCVSAAALAFPLAGCGPVDVRGIPFQSLDRPTQAKYSRAIATVFARAQPLTVYFERGDLARRPRDAATLVRLGYVERKNGAYRFTAAGRKASAIRCDYAGGPCATVFVVGRSELASVGKLRFHQSSWPGGADAVLVNVRLRAIATTNIGRALAASSNLQCKSHGVTSQWHESGTEADGVVVLPLSAPQYAQYDLASVVDDAVEQPDEAKIAGATLFTSCPSYRPTLPPIIDGWSIDDAETEAKNRLDPLL